MKANIFLLCCFVLMHSANSFSQNNFKPGYLITMEKDTVKGQINFRAENKNYKSCQFKKGEETKEYSPSQIHGYGIFGGRFYTSGIVDNGFAETLVVGELSLYQFRSHYILNKDGNTYTLVSKDIETDNNGNRAVYEDKSWRRIVAYLISDCLPEPNQIVAHISLQEKSMVRLVSRYNKCKHNDFIVFKEPKSWTKFELGASIGMHRSTLRIYDEFEQQFFYLNDPYQSTDPSVGLVISLLSPRLSERISFQAEVHYFKTAYSSQLIIERSLTEIHNTDINLTTLATPLSFKYNIPYKRFSLNFQVGFNMDHHLDMETKWEVQRILGDQTTSTKTRNPFSMYKTQNGIWAGAGFKKNLKMVNLEASIRYFQLPGYNENFFSMNRMGANLIISR